MFKKLLSVITCFVMLFVLVNTAYSSSLEFKDIPASYSWAVDAINSLAEAGVVNGTAQNEFSPEKNVTRAEFITMLVRMLDLKDNFGECFNDVKSTDYYYQAVGIAKTYGLIKGDEIGNFNPNVTITRQDLFVILHRALQSKGDSTKGNYFLLQDFKDSPLISDYAVEAIITLLNCDLIQGDSGQIKPLGFATRAETAVLLARLKNYLEATLDNAYVPNNMSLLFWPTISNEITLRFGAVDSIYNVVHTGIDIQSEDYYAMVFSAANGRVAYVGTSAYYGNVVYVNSRYKGNNIQIRYAHLKSETIKVAVGDIVSMYDFIAEMGTTGNAVINSSYMPRLLELEILQSTNGKPCEIDGSNTVNVNPLDYFETIRTDGYYMTQPYNFSINTGGGNKQTAADKAYLANTGLPEDYAYLRKIVEECIREKENDNNGENADLYLSYDSSTGVATVNLNGRSQQFSPSLGNAININGRLAVSYPEFINSLYRTESIIPYD